MYYKVLAATFIILFATWIIGAVLGSRKIEKACVIGVILLATSSALVWVLAGIPPIPQWITRHVTKLLHR